MDALGRCLSGLIRGELQRATGRMVLSWLDDSKITGTAIKLAPLPSVKGAKSVLCEHVKALKVLAEACRGSEAVLPRYATRYLMVCLRHMESSSDNCCLFCKVIGNPFSHLTVLRCAKTRGGGGPLRECYADS